MWSYVQYRRIGQKVEEELKKRSGKETTGQQSVSMGRLPDIENGNTWTGTSPKKTELQAGFEPHRRQEARDKSLEEKQGAGKKLDRVVIKVSGEDDPIDPKNWGVGERAKNIAILSLLIFVQAWAGGAESMANAKASREFHVSKTAENLATAMYLFGIGSGALFVGPLSESVGRNPTYLTSTFCYLFFVLGSALTPTFGGQVICRYFVGLFSSATLAINGASVRDQFRPVKRAFVFPVIAWANIVRTGSESSPVRKTLMSQLQPLHLRLSSVAGLSQAPNSAGDGQSGSPLLYLASASSLR
jgi:MFS transporter, DHA1 family, multidrug resistance protein